MFAIENTLVPKYGERGKRERERRDGIHESI